MKNIFFLADIFPYSIVSILKGGEKVKKPLTHTNKEIEEVYARHADTVYRLCYSFMKNKRDTEDAVQDTFLKFIA